MTTDADPYCTPDTVAVWCLLDEHDVPAAAVWVGPLHTEPAARSMIEAFAAESPPHWKLARVDPEHYRGVERPVLAYTPADAVEQPEAEPMLYGIPGAEELFFDPAECYEAQIEPWADEHDRRPREIEEWTVHPPRYHCPNADWVLDNIVEWIADNGEVDEAAFDSWGSAATNEDVKAAAEALLDTLAAHVTYRMADRHVRSMAVTWDADGQPLLDGEPLYRPRGES